MRTSNIIIPLIITFSLIAAGCQNRNVKTLKDDHMSMMQGMSMTTTSVLAGDQLQFKTANPWLNPNFNFEFKLINRDETELTSENLQFVHEKLIHMIIVKNDFSVYEHIHPLYDDGYWHITSPVNDPGDYFAYIDFTPRNGQNQILRLPFTIPGKATTQTKPQPNTQTKAESIIMTLESSDIKSGTISELHFNLSKDNKPLSNLEPYLGAYGHMVALNQDNPIYYIHAHPTTLEKQSDGKITFAATFPTAGIYTLFTQIQTDGQVITLPITIKVK